MDCLSSTNPYIILQNKESLEKYSNQRTQNPDLTCQSSELIFDLKKEEVFKQLNNLNLNKDFELICKFKLQQDLTFPTPENKYLLLFKGKGENNYVYYYNDNNKLLCGSLQKDTYFPAIISNFIDISILVFLGILYKYKEKKINKFMKKYTQYAIWEENNILLKNSIRCSYLFVLNNLNYLP